jgi:hypothetical protein
MPAAILVAIFIGDSLHSERHLDGDPNRDRPTFMLTWRERPLLQRGNGVSIHLLIKTAHELYISGRAFARDDAFDLNRVDHFLPPSRGRMNSHTPVL